MKVIDRNIIQKRCIKGSGQARAIKNCLELDNLKQNGNYWTIFEITF